ncbi:MAG: radical SAM family heme chaperone HemW [Peptococcaceae bacterium]|nr:radical SAM family heme chaperone HemW [Peptococcaceae bacterium]MDH7524503.1 radical SAM family heme chaperone HemW [Peptococcaceae bacterium]
MFSGIYVHIPFCLTRCRYCDFVSYGLDSEGQTGSQAFDSYLAALLAEAGIYRRELDLGRERAKTLYIGGGTPTCLSGGQLYHLLTSLQEHFPLEQGAEVTVEGNPETLEGEKLRALKAGGCNRLSLGAQSFDYLELSVLGRVHKPEDIYRTFFLARECGFENINIDLMYGLPGQDLRTWRANLLAAVSLDPEHLSVYQLKIEKGTPFHEMLVQGLLVEFDQDEASRMYEETIDFLTGKGYLHYEISNFARRGKESRHNAQYWRNEGYLGLGAGASGYLNGTRYTNHSDLGLYTAAVREGKKPVLEEERPGKELVIAEAMFLGLRLLEGVEKRGFYSRYGLEIEECYGPEIERLKKLELLADTGTHVRLTRKGLLLANEVFMEFLP